MAAADQYLAALEPQKRLAPHLHAGIRGAIPQSHPPPGGQSDLRPGVVAAARAPHVCRPRSFPVWDGSDLDERSGVIVPTWEEALDQLDCDPVPGRLVKRIGTPRNPAQQESIWAGKPVTYASKAAQSIWDVTSPLRSGPPRGRPRRRPGRCRRSGRPEASVAHLACRGLRADPGPGQPRRRLRRERARSRSGP